MKPDSGVMLCQEVNHRKYHYETPAFIDNLKLDSCFIMLHTLEQWQTVLRLHMPAEIIDSLTIDNGTQVNRPTKNGFESHSMEEELC